MKAAAIKRAPTNTNIPDELIFEVLTYLPVKSLVRFKCVSKSWHILISSPQFIKNHLAKSRENDEYAHHRVIFHTLEPNLKQCCINSVLHAPLDIESIDVDDPMRDHYYKGFVSSCNGLFCIVVDVEQIFLWNPALRKSRKLPKLPIMGGKTKNLRKKRRRMVYGYGYDELNDDYKVVYYRNCGWDSRVHVYSLKRNSWRRIGDFNKGVPSDQWGHFSNGNLHWIVNRDKIVSFDMAKETFGEVQLPKFEEETTDWSLEVVSGTLALYQYFRRYRVDVWIMKEYGVGDSWTRVVFISHSNDINGLERYLFCLPVFHSKNGEILFKSACGGGIALYSPRTNSLTYPKIRNLTETPWGLDMYVESLVLPDPNRNTSE
ncbi:hypothetical protein ACH5RR_031753 [Cinchona calisaya]|uniref:F-box domain-containing protein n=1 Tax=Cinchona calisaya TaxID=153742 RepID=A0ABD2YHI0_9GENT